ncbi:unnamed protein product [Phytophthora lilii]|uniref:Unnamed protein product n=1 Tax=Phytophthora lilii TaxID=2077276 RepID=A0A9W6X6Y0_9STRA|nr:unnamed protein product [Phytophthora lilii]
MVLAKQSRYECNVLTETALAAGLAATSNQLDGGVKAEAESPTPAPGAGTSLELVGGNDILLQLEQYSGHDAVAVAHALL